MNISNDTWFTYSAQIVNFLILVWLLRRFLYRPVLRAIERREQGFIAREKEANKVEAKAGQLLKEYQQQLNALEQSREVMMGQVKEEVSQWKSEQIEQAKEEVAQAHQRWRSAYRQEREKILRTMQEQAGIEIQEMARTVLRELADCDLETLVIDVFLKHFSESPEGLSQFDISGISERQVRIRSAFQLGEDSRERIIRLLNEQSEKASDSIDHFELEVVPELICGIELVYGDRRWSWNLAQSFDELAQRLELLLNSEATEPYLAGEASA